MRVRRSISVPVTVAALVVVGVPFAAHAADAAGPRIGAVAGAPQLDAGRRETFRVHPSGLPGGSRLALQQNTAARQSWRTVATAPATARTITSKPLAMGRYRFRVVAVHGATVLAASAVKIIRAYRSFTLGQLCAQLSFDPGDDGGCDGGNDWTYTGGKKFVAQIVTFSGALSDGYTGAFWLHNSSCRSLTVRFTNTEAHDQRTYLRIAQRTGHGVEAAKATARRNVIGSLHVRLEGGKWWEVEDATDGGGDEMMYRGTLSCFTSTGVR